MSTPSPRPASDTIKGAVCGLASAALFGVSAPAAKLLLPRMDSWVLAGLLYVGAGVGLSVVRRGRGRSRAAGPHEDDGLGRRDLPLLVAIAIIGGGIGPVLMLVGLRHLSGVAGALLLNLEAVFTALLAVTAFGERLTRLEGIAAAIIIAGAVMISAGGGTFRAEPGGVLAITAACFSWGVDNNLTAKLSRRNAVDLVRFKALTAGIGNLAIATIAGQPLPSPRLVATALGIGFVCYGVSIVLDVYALRFVGAAREAAFFATAPFAGAVAAMPLLGEAIGARDVSAAAVMAVGVALLLAARRRNQFQE